MFRTKNIPAVLILVFGIIELINNFLITYFEEAQPYSFVYKFIIVVLLLFLSKKNYNQYLPAFFLLLMFFFIGQYFTIQYEIGYLKNLGLFFKYIYVFLLVIGLKPLINKTNYEPLKMIFQLLFGVFLFSILTSFFLNIESLSTYEGLRFGFKGLINKSSDLTYFLCLGIISTEILNFKFRKYFLLAFAVAILISGTKASLLFLSLYLCHLLYKNKLNYKKLLIYTLSSSVFVFFIYKIFTDKLKSTFQIFSNLYENEGLFSAVTSFRTRKLFELSTIYLEEWNYANYLFGGKIAYYLHTEFDIVDIFIFFGFAGGAYYILLLYKIVFNGIFKNYTYLIVILLFIACLVGQFFYNTFIAIIIAFLVNLERVQSSQEKK
jgi:hypothetical protein